MSEVKRNERERIKQKKISVGCYLFFNFALLAMLRILMGQFSDDANRSDFFLLSTSVLVIHSLCYRSEMSSLEINNF